MKVYSIYITFTGSSKAEIDEIRQQHDELHKKIAAHVTVVFPFESRADETELIRLLNPKMRAKAFSFSVAREVTQRENIGYLKVLKGTSHFHALYASLNSTLNLENTIPYEPHVTITRNCEPIEKVELQNVEFMTEAVILEKIYSNGRGRIIYQWPNAESES
ncbi:2'-5' RNA ligase family protein [Gilvimarinus sp. DA14]|uniref:2'-5' RNA ligase family protein n=1 Tax=Gilvimarinus sp. DA14 TaxID=2956798 RepID=UPI0020B87A59|nr:2'-5' RNA ligase family protein [Gilvimarinus sp. DA14]UTF61789.1 2'-5' RNA ligase family protein [Gilvimarinus sp. DA14]